MESAPEVGSTREEGGSRRELLLGIGLIGVAAAACGGGEDDPAQVLPGTSEAQPPATLPTATGQDTTAPTGGALGSAADIPVGGGMVYKAEKIVVTQPKKDVYKAFSAICTHAGCTVDQVADGTINCPCHGSKYAVADGSVVNGPAERPLDAKKIKVTGGEITIIQ